MQPVAVMLLVVGVSRVFRHVAEMQVQSVSALKQFERAAEVVPSDCNHAVAAPRLLMPMQPSLCAELAVARRQQAAVIQPDCYRGEAVLR